MNVYDLVIHDKEIVTLEDTVLPEDKRENIRQLIREHQFIQELHQFGLPVANKILLHGPSGCGKTMTAKGIAQALHKNILVLNLSNVVVARIGETAQHIKMVFDKAAREKAVLFLDEFDHIGKTRGEDNKDVGEMRRLVNSLIQLIDYYPENTLLIAATNHPEIIDPALLRRFQLRLSFDMPARDMLDGYYDKLLSRFPARLTNIERKYNISFAEARDHAFNLVKAGLIRELENKPVLT